MKTNKIVGLALLSLSTLLYIWVLNLAFDKENEKAHMVTWVSTFIAIAGIVIITLHRTLKIHDYPILAAAGLSVLLMLLSSYSDSGLFPKFVAILTIMAAGAGLLLEKKDMRYINIIITSLGFIFVLISSYNNWNPALRLVSILILLSGIAGFVISRLQGGLHFHGNFLHI